jgi:hypothetical protein
MPHIVKIARTMFSIQRCIHFLNNILRFNETVIQHGNITASFSSLCIVGTTTNLDAVCPNKRLQLPHCKLIVHEAALCVYRNDYEIGVYQFGKH